MRVDDRALAKTKVSALEGFHAIAAAPPLQFTRKRGGHSEVVHVDVTGIRTFPRKGPGGCAVTQQRDLLSSFSGGHSERSRGST